MKKWMEGNLDLERVNLDLDPGLVNLDLDLGNDKLTTRDKPDSALIPKLMQDRSTKVENVGSSEKIREEDRDGRDKGNFGSRTHGFTLHRYFIGFTLNTYRRDKGVTLRKYENFH